MKHLQNTDKVLQNIIIKEMGETKSKDTRQYVTLRKPVNLEGRKPPPFHSPNDATVSNVFGWKSSINEGNGQLSVLNYSI